MNYRSAKLFLIPALLTLAAQLICVSGVQRKKPPERRPQPALPTVSCSGRGIKAVFGPLVRDTIRVQTLTGAAVPVRQAEGSCGVTMGQEKNQSLSFVSRYDSCYARVEGSKVVVPLQVQLTGEDRWIRVNISCSLIKRRNEKIHPTSTSFPGKCNIERALRINCGPRSISSDTCNKLGCCYDALDLTCFYKLNACSLDGHFVFSVKATDTHPPVDPSSLVIKHQPHCFPVVTTPDTAVFKIGVTECGAKMTAHGDMVTYEVEVGELHSRRTTKHSPFSLQVECEYEASDLKHAKDLRSLYAVTNPPPVVAQGTIKVQMRIATDASFTSFVAENQLPLTLPLRKPVNVEISIMQPSPDPTLSLRIRDCFAYPVSRHSVWTLLYDGCPNPVDNMRSSIQVDKQGKTDFHSQVRRFDVKTFAFLDPRTGNPSVEEMYFYCWVEICTNEVECAQRCTIISSESVRQRREAISESNRLQLVSLGPLVLVQNNTEPTDDPCMKHKTMFRVTVYVLCGVSAALLLMLFLVICTRIRRCQKSDTQRACDAQADSEPSQ
ncbi:zona pellucida sperm-binding protein 4-like [Stegastes partitus]|uniref:Zona pellucida sperm-binding protein 4-like n=1 Tax=Stegastes partitus TaxID=144197 RepID=A0A9Y4N463_9TELE|nr:PREDICTED: zona pellucida sperm-binding protein 4-like [Stegastes partitus]